MRIGRRSFGLVVLLALLAAGAAMADDYGYMGGSSGAPAREEQITLASSSAFTGTLAALSEINHELLVKTTVPGLMGPEERVIPFKVGDDTTLTICFKSLNSCESALTGAEGWDKLSSLEELSTFAKVKKDVVVVGESNSDRIVHVQIEYEM